LIQINVLLWSSFSYFDNQLIALIILRYISLSFLFFSLWLSVDGQEALGFKLGNYAGTERIFLNPALSQTSAYKWEANLASIHGFFYSDYAFIKETSLLSLINTDVVEVLTLKSQVTENLPDNTLVFDLNGGDKVLSAHLDVSGPSLITNFFGGYKIGVFTKFRANISSGRISENFGIYELNESFSRQQINFKKTQIAGMSWREIGIHLSKSFEQFDTGINIKHLKAYGGFFAKVDTDQDVDYTGGIISFGSNELAGGVGYTTDGLNNSEFDPLANNGHRAGFSVDLGVRFNVEEISVGVSILDLGFINFKDNVENYALPDNYTDFDVDPNDYVDITNLEQLIDQVEEDTPFASDQNNGGFLIGTPVALNISADYPVSNKLFVSASATQRIKLLGISTISDNAFSVVPRFQSNWISAYLPVTVYNYSRVQVGAAARLAYLTIGSDDIISVFREADFRGSDIYIKLSVTPLFKIKRRRRLGSRQSGSSAKCYEF